MRPARRRFATHGLALLAMAGTLQGAKAGAAAQPDAAPQSDEMVNALRPTRQRNLTVRPAAAQDAAPAASQPHAAEPAVAAAGSAPPQARPSLSLVLPFEVSSARLRPESGPILGNLVAAMLSPELKSQRFVIEGHTDASGAAAQNLRLSQARADEVRLYLVALGVHPSRLRAVGKGSSEPANPQDPLAANNRRVRVVTLE